MEDCHVLPRPPSCLWWECSPPSWSRIKWLTSHDVPARSEGMRVVILLAKRLKSNFIFNGVYYMYFRDSWTLNYCRIFWFVLTECELRSRLTLGSVLKLAPKYDLWIFVTVQLLALILWGLFLLIIIISSIIIIFNKIFRSNRICWVWIFNRQESWSCQFEW